LKRLPSEAIRAGNVYVSCENEEKLLPVVADYLGADHMIFATDFPHELAYEGYIKEAAEFAERSDLADSLKKKILADNSIRLYNLAG
jgi:predicted TIM-barrel fold metal-dependent hydrolase